MRCPNYFKLRALFGTLSLLSLSIYTGLALRLVVTGYEAEQSGPDEPDAFRARKAGVPPTPGAIVYRGIRVWA